MVATLTKAKAKDSLLPDLKPELFADEFSASLDIQQPVFKRYKGQQIGEQAKYVQVRFDDKLVRKWDCLEIHQLTDVQFGHVCCKEHRLEEFIEHILEKDNRFILLTGDNIDAAHIGSPGGTQENKWRPSTQLRRFCQILAPASHRVLGSVSGNHEQRAMLYFGDLGTLISMILKVPFSSGQQTVDVHFGMHKPFRFELWHGRGAARTPGAQMNMIVEHMLQNPSADAIMVGHLHNALSHKRWVKVPDAANMNVRLKQQYGVMSSSFLEFFGNYAEVKGLSAGDVAMAKLRLYADGNSELIT